MFESSHILFIRFAVVMLLIFFHSLLHNLDRPLAKVEGWFIKSFDCSAVMEHMVAPPGTGRSWQYAAGDVDYGSEGRAGNEPINHCMGLAWALAIPE
jgi:hypothetical protein